MGYENSLTQLHSDTLKSAIFSSALVLDDLNEIQTEELWNSFIVSSAFPYLKAELFFPKPMLGLQEFEEEHDANAKKFKKISFIGKSYFEDLLHGGKKRISKKHISSRGDFLSDHPDLQGSDYKVMQKELQQRITVPRGSLEDTVPFYQERIFFEQDAGLWFILEASDQKHSALVNGAIGVLGESGVGTDRNVGNGQFSIETDELELNLPEAGNKQINLGLFCPDTGDLNSDLLAESSYLLIKRGGYISNLNDPQFLSYRKKSVYMFQEGSAFAGMGKLNGKFVDLKPEAVPVNHPIWREGRAIFLPCKEN